MNFVRQILFTLKVLTEFLLLYLIDNMDAIICAPELNLTMMKGKSFTCPL